MNEVKLVIANCHDASHAIAIDKLVYELSEDDVSGNVAASLPDTSAAQDLAKFDFAIVILAYIDDEPVGLAICYLLYSTFIRKPYLNIHDLVVTSKHRGKKIGSTLLEKVATIGIAKDCGKVTLEVVEGNKKAMSLYERHGFSDVSPSPSMGRTLYWSKKLQQ